jgi:hypothetical protein
LLSAAPAHSATFRKGPYLVYPDDNTQMTVLWQADSTPAGSFVEWGETTAYGSTSGALTESGNGANEHQFEHTITTLTPGTRYYYRVDVDGNRETGAFLAGVVAAQAAVTIYAYGDTRTNPGDHDAVCAALLKDVDDAPEWRQTISLLAGDWVNAGNNETDWDNQYFDRTRSNALEFMSRMAVMGCRGNHEGTAVLLRKYWPYAYQDGTGCYFSFDYGPVHVTVIDQYVTYSNPSTQYTWIANDLAGTSKTWKIVLWHQPAWGAGTSHGNDATAQGLQGLFESEGVLLVVAGHNHNYARCLVNGVHHITAGGGGAPLRAVDLGYPNLVTAEMALHFVRLDISGDTMSVTVIRDDSTVLETFDITQGADTTPPSVVGVTASGDPTEVKVIFGERVEAGTGAGGAENTANYSLPGFTLTGAALDAVGMTVTLTVTPDMTNGQGYTLTVSGINDRAAGPNTMPAPQAVDFTHIYTEPPVTVFQQGDTWKYFKGDADPGATWDELGYDDTGWLEGPTGIGYGDGDDATVLGDMQNGYTTVFMRRAFTVTDPAEVKGLTFSVVYDDGFAAYINGTLVASRNAPGTITNTSVATAGHEAGAAEIIDITAGGGPALQAGANVFAIVLLNVSLGSSDASMIPALIMDMERGALEFESSTYSCSEADGTATITVTRTGGSYGAVSVSFAASDGSAVSASDEDYTATSGVLSWGDGDTAAKSFPVTITDDGVGEPAETVLLALSGPTGGATLGTDAAILTILDDDDGPPAPAIISTPTSGATVSGIVNIAGTASDDWAVAGVEVSIGGGPFQPATGTDNWTFAWDTHTVPDGSVTITIRVTDDNGHTTDEVLSVVVANGAGLPAAGGGGGCAAAHGHGAGILASAALACAALVLVLVISDRRRADD